MDSLKDVIIKTRRNNMNITKGSEMISLRDYYGKAQHCVKSQQIHEMAIEDRVDIHYPKSWLDKLDFIDKVHEEGAKSDKEIVENLKSVVDKEGKK